MKAKLRLLQVTLAASILAFVVYEVYTSWHSFGWLLFSFGLMCMVALFTIGGMVRDKRVSLGSKLAVFCLGVILIVAGILLASWGL
jgi:1,4-dihydroxy-2-naphthoate octaprenyltransferase